MKIVVSSLVAAAVVTSSTVSTAFAPTVVVWVVASKQERRRREPRTGVRSAHQDDPRPYCWNNEEKGGHDRTTTTTTPPASAFSSSRRELFSVAAAAVATVVGGMGSLQMPPAAAWAADTTATATIDYSKVQDLLGVPDATTQAYGGPRSSRPTWLTEPTDEFKANEAKASDFKRAQLQRKQQFLNVLERLETDPNDETKLANDLDELRKLVRSSNGLPLGVTKDELVKRVRRRKAKRFWPTNVEIAYVVCVCGGSSQTLLLWFPVSLCRNLSIPVMCRPVFPPSLTHSLTHTPVLFRFCRALLLFLSSSSQVPGLDPRNYLPTKPQHRTRCGKSVLNQRLGYELRVGSDFVVDE